jgi:gamma-glutamyltranspeptidase/glutathione hydrolase
MEIDLSQLASASGRQPLLAGRGVVSTSQPLAAQAGLAILRQGGSAVDAAIATAIALTVVEPTSNGIGSDLFALVWDGQQLHGLNASGRAPAALTHAGVRALGHAAMPTHGWLPVTVPGAVAGWRDLHARFGKLPFASLFEDAIGYAERGYPLGPVLAHSWARGAASARARTAPEFAGWMPTFAPGGSAPAAGTIWRSPDHARTLRMIAETGAAAFYQGELAERIAGFAAATGGLISAADLAAHTSTWVEPISTSYRGYDVWEIPPNGQGIAALIALNILEGFDPAEIARDTEAGLHRQIEAMKLAFADAHRYVADPHHADVPTAALLDKRYAARRRALIGERALDPRPGDPLKGGTVYLCAADADGMMISLIQSNYLGFGSGVVIPGTGIALQNRGAGFSLEDGHPNQLAPGKRPFHTIIPAFLTHGGQPIGPFGVMGGHMQPQGHVQMVLNTIDRGLNPQASLDAPRWYWEAGREVLLEPGAPPEMAAALSRRGHEVAIADEYGTFGRGQIIWRLASGAYVAGSDGRADGAAAGY